MSQISSFDFEQALRKTISEALKSLYETDLPENSISFQETNREFEGDLTLVVFPFTKFSKKSPEQTANDIGEFILNSSFPLASFNVVKGFLNLVVDDSVWKKFFFDNCKDPDKLFSPETIRKGKPGYLMVEYSSPNTNKPLHLGHVRNNLLGFSIAEILKANGHRVVMVNLVNDRGIHICKSMLAWQKFGNGETPESAGMKGDHLVGKYYVIFDKKYREEVEHLVKQGKPKEEAEKSAPLQMEIEALLRKWEAGDAATRELWSMMNNWVYQGFEKTYSKLGVSFDKIYYESETYVLGKEIVEEGLKQNVFFRGDDNAIRVDLAEAGLDQKVIIRSDGTSVYITQDIATAKLRFEDDFPGLEKLIYVVGNEQEYHFKVLKEILKKLGKPWAEGLFHLSYGMVDLPSGKMKSREGTVVDADDLIHEIEEQAEMTTKAQGKLDHYDNADARELYHNLGMGALKYFILKVDPKKRMLFNPAESIDLNGNTGPFIQYAYARIKSVLRKGHALQKNELNALHKISPEEKHLIRLIYNYPKTVREAGENYSPAVIANYVYNVAKAYNHFYYDHVVVDETQPEVSAFRLKLSESTSLVISRSLALLGIHSPERM